MSDIYFKIDEDFETIINNAFKDKKVYNMHLITTGWTNIVYEVETEDGNYFCRFPRDEFWSRTIVKDCEFAKYIYQKTNFNTCKLELKEDKGRPFSVHKKIPGTPLAEKMNELSKEEIEEISDDISKFMCELHSINPKKDKIFSINNIGLELREFLDELLSKHIDKKEMAFWKCDSKVNAPECLVHGDLNSSNVLLDENNKVTAVIDFGFAGFGNSYDDVARIIGRCPENFRDSIIKSYEKYSNTKIDEGILNSQVKEWNNIDQSYINYMRKIGIYE